MMLGESNIDVVKLAEMREFEQELNTTRSSYKKNIKREIAIHTTKYKYSSNINMIDNTSTVLFYRQDIEQIITKLELEGHEVEDIDFASGLLSYEHFPHLKLKVEKYILTLIGIFIKKSL